MLHLFHQAVAMTLIQSAEPDFWSVDWDEDERREKIWQSYYYNLKDLICRCLGEDIDVLCEADGDRGYKALGMAMAIFSRLPIESLSQTECREIFKDMYQKELEKMEEEQL